MTPRRNPARQGPEKAIQLLKRVRALTASQREKAKEKEAASRLAHQKSIMAIREGDREKLSNFKRIMILRLREVEKLRERMKALRKKARAKARKLYGKKPQ